MYFSTYYRLFEIFCGIVFLTVMYLLSKKAIKAAEKAVRKKYVIDCKKWHGIFFPAIKVLFLSLGLCYFLSGVASYVGLTGVGSDLRPIRDCLIVMSFFWMAYRAKQFFLPLFSFQGNHGVSKLLSILLGLVTLLIILGIFHLDIIPLLAFGGIGAASLGFAAKDVMSSFFGGIMLAVTRSFTVGDQILIPEKNLEGFIEEIGWNITLVRNKDRAAVYLPNTIFSQVLVINLSRRTGRRILETFYLRHEDADKLFSVISEVRQALEKYDRLDHAVPLLVYMSAVGKYSVDFGIDVYTNVTSLSDYVAVKEEVLKRVCFSISKAGARPAQPILLGEAPSTDQLS